MNDEEKAVENTKKYLNDIYQDMIGKDIQFESPIKDENNKQIKKFIIYTDFTASGKGLNSIENLIYKTSFIKENNIRFDNSPAVTVWNTLHGHYFIQ